MWQILQNSVWNFHAHVRYTVLISVSYATQHVAKNLVWIYKFSLILKKESESIFDFLFNVWNRKKIVSLITHQIAWFFIAISSCLTTMFQLRYFDFLTLYFSFNFIMVLLWIKTNKKLLLLWRNHLEIHREKNERN